MKIEIKGFECTPQPCGCPDCVIAGKNAPHKYWYPVYRVKYTVTVPSNLILRYVKSFYFRLFPKKWRSIMKKSSEKELLTCCSTQSEVQSFLFDWAAGKR